jgi:hypothetical protein
MAKVVKRLHTFTELEGQLPLSKELATDLCPASDTHSPHPNMIFIYYPFNIILIAEPRPAK